VEVIEKAQRVVFTHCALADPVTEVTQSNDDRKALVNPNIDPQYSVRH